MSRYARGERDAGFLMGALTIVMGGWLPATVTRFLIGSRIGDPAAVGLDFAFAAIFGAMLFGSWRGRFDLVPWAAAGLGAWRGSGTPWLARSVDVLPRRFWPARKR